MESVKMRKGLIEENKDEFVVHRDIHRDVDIFMIANPISGSREAVAYTELTEKEYEFKFGNLPGLEDTSATVRLRIINILNENEVSDLKENVNEGLIAKLCKNPNDQNSVIILTGAGDGTFMNIAQEFKEFGIDINMLLFCVFPFGTANDVARNFGWGCTPTVNMLRDLKIVGAEILMAREANFDVWEVEVITDEDGGDIQKAKEGDLESLENSNMLKYMCHSFSFGSDARTGLAFERRRTRNRVGNRIRYGYEGFKNFIRCWGERTMKIKQILRSFKKIEIGDKKFEQQVYTSNDSLFEDNAEMLKSSKDDDIIVAANKDIMTDNYMIHNPVSFYGLNLPDIMNENINLWSGGRNTVGMENFEGERIQDKPFTKEPAYDDGMLEFATFDSLLKFILNMSNSIYQGGGMFEFDFIEDEDIRTYLNIDGEFYKVFNIRKIYLRKGDSLCVNGLLRVLVNDRKEIFG